MTKNKIKKNLSDEEMFAGWKEENTFENNPGEDIFSKSSPARAAKNQVKKEEDSFLTQELHAQVNKALLEQKIQLYREGVVDYQIKVYREGKQVILEAIPKGVGKKEKRIK
ncbi:hypothetical protein [Desulforamulus aquiferis]|uniref:Uncharacterized protein n=1 Tax=Desulforamulus aquiferis TaxID=1397668 RepID=A0AAW7ZH32_9FIRM|nr:hypothetical protein [Desulforamulus aquiferis]MDO7789002.1 hypothetical protein [Desulforamulus aquiferis]RYD01400.1 hypothetical protein N752_30870 [Desulforamulus aquiferis]